MKTLFKVIFYLFILALFFGISEPFSYKLNFIFLANIFLLIIIFESKFMNNRLRYILLLIFTITIIFYIFIPKRITAGWASQYESCNCIGLPYYNYSVISSYDNIIDEGYPGCIGHKYNCEKLITDY